jgi:hypothetical protein
MTVNTCDINTLNEYKYIHIHTINAMRTNGTHLLSELPLWLRATPGALAKRQLAIGHKNGVSSKCISIFVVVDVANTIHNHSIWQSKCWGLQKTVLFSILLKVC